MKKEKQRSVPVQAPLLDIIWSKDPGQYSTASTAYHMPIEPGEVISSGGFTMEDLERAVQNLPTNWERAYHVHEIVGMLRLMRYVEGQECRAFTRHLMAIASKMPYMDGRFTITERGVALVPRTGDPVTLR